MIPVNEPLLLEEDFESLQACFRSGWISSTGPFLEEFENAWASYCGVKHGIGVSNGTTALQVAVEAVGVGRGDEVIMPSFTIISCASAVVRAGAVPVLVDCDPETFCMRVDQIEARITPHTKAIMVVHMYGQPADMDPILALGRKYGLKVIEDAAEVHGSEYLTGRHGDAPTWRRCGGLSDVATFSFFANKLVTTGEGGMVVTQDDNIAKRCRSLRNLCFQPTRRFLHFEHGYQYRLTNLQAAIGLRQVARMDTIIQRKRWIGDEYTKRLHHLNGIQLPIESPYGKHVYWIYSLVLDDSLPLDAEMFARKLYQLDIDTRPFFLGMHEQPVFHDMGLFKGESYPVTERISRRGFYLPSGLGLSLEQIEKVSAAVIRVMKNL